MFSSRLPESLVETPVSRRLRQLRAARVPVIDLTASNPTRVGIPYPAEISRIFAEAGAVVYRPEPRGAWSAREAVAALYAEDQGLTVSPEQVVLTAGTSEAYSFLFKLLANPGDEVLVPVPGYPLIEHLARLEGLTSVPFPSWFDGRWQVDLEAARSRVTPRTRAVVVVNPNNPTGAFLTEETHAGLVGLCREADLALISDEVFTDYPRPPRIPGDVVRTVASRAEVLCFSLGGLSKALGLPGMKLSWILVNGPESMRRAALERLEFIADNYLSVTTPVQNALPGLLALRKPVQAAIQARLNQNLEHARRAFGHGALVSLVPSEAGWYQILRVPNVAPEEALAVALLDDEHVHVHPGFFFDFPGEGYLVTSLLVPPDLWMEGLEAIRRQVDKAVHPS